MWFIRQTMLRIQNKKSANLWLNLSLPKSVLIEYDLQIIAKIENK
jgi:hypothetical protein